MPKEVTKSLDKFFVISSQPLFQGLTDKEKTLVANRSKIVEYDKNEFIYRQGDQRDFFSIVITGRIQLFNPSVGKKNETNIPIEVVRKGDYFGLISVLTNRTHSVSARVLNDARLIQIEHRAFHYILRKVPALSIRFSHTLSRRIARRDFGKKEIFQSTVLVVCGQDEKFATRYAMALGLRIMEGSGKDAVYVSLKDTEHRGRQGRLSCVFPGNREKKELSLFIGNLSCRYHFVIIDVPFLMTKEGTAVLDASDQCHVIVEGNDYPAKRIAAIAARMSKKSDLRVIVREHGRKQGDAGKQVDVFERLSEDEKEFGQTIRRIARLLSGLSVGLALGSGGAIGLAQVGILDVFDKEKIPVDIIAGTSIGAFIGSLWACGFSSKEIEKICTTFDSKMKTIGLIDITMPHKGLISGNKVRNFLKAYFGKRTFRDVRIPLRIVACDISTRREVVIKEGRILDAVMASISIPGVFNPVISDKGEVLVDGGIITPLPINVLIREGIKRVIAVHSIPSPEDARAAVPGAQNIFDILVNSIYAMEYTIGKFASQEADVYMHPIPDGAQWYEFYRAREFIRFGQQYARQNLGKVRKLIRKT